VLTARAWVLMVSASVFARAMSWLRAAPSPGLLATSCQPAWNSASAAATPLSPGSPRVVSNRVSAVD